MAILNGICTTNKQINVISGTGAINIGTDSTAKAVTIGSTTSNSSVTIDSGTGNINIGTFYCKIYNNR
jgi:hypothetical protein